MMFAPHNKPCYYYFTLCIGSPDVFLIIIVLHDYKSHYETDDRTMETRNPAFEDVTSNSRGPSGYVA